MPGHTVEQRVLERIAASEHVLTVHYPAVITTASGSSPTPTAPLSPLTGAATALVAVGPAPTPRLPPVDLRCLWLDAHSGVSESMRVDRRSVRTLGWVQGANALARVAVSPHADLGITRGAAVDPEAPYGDTVFTGCEVVEYLARRYRVISVQPMGSSFRLPATYYVWLESATKG